MLNALFANIKGETVSMQEQELILKLKKGDKASFTALYDLYWAKVYNFTQLYITVNIDAEEIVQEVFIKIWEGRSTIDENKNFSGFLFIITRNIIFNHARSSFNKGFYRLTISEAAELQSDNFIEEVTASDLLKCINELIEQLPARQREVFILSREKQLSYKEISELLCITPKTVERHINEALKHLKKNFPTYNCLLLLCMRNGGWEW